ERAEERRRAGARACGRARPEARAGQGAGGVRSEREAELAEALLDLVERGLAEVLDREELGLALRAELADRADVEPLHAVARANRQLEVADRLLEGLLVAGAPRLLG